MAMTPQMRQVESLQAEWQDLFEVEKVKKGKDFAKLHKISIVAATVATGQELVEHEIKSPSLRCDKQRYTTGIEDKNKQNER